MSIGRPILDGNSFISNNAIAKLTNVFAESNEIQKNKLLAEKHGVAYSEYKAENYTRVAFSNAEDLNAFTESMRSEGVTDMVSTAYKYNGQYIVEMPKEMENGINAEMLIENYERTTGYYVEDVKSDYHDTQTESPEKAEASLAREVLLKYLDGADEVLTPIINTMYWSEYKSYQDDYSSGTNIFHHKANNDGDISMSADVGRNSERAIVLNNDTVVINGQIVTDEEIRSNILKQHEERMAYTYDSSNFRGTDDVGIMIQNSRREHSAMQTGASQMNETADMVGRLLAKEQNNGLTNIEQNQLNMAKAKLDDYKAVYGYDFDIRLVREGTSSLYTYTTKNITTTEFRENNEKLLSALESQGYNVRGRGGVFDTDTFRHIKQEDYSALGLTPQIADMFIDVNANTHKLTPKQELAEKIKENVYRQEYTYESHQPNQNGELAFCQWSYGSLADITTALNESNIAIRVSNAEKLQSTFARDEIAIFQDKIREAGISESVLYENPTFALSSIDIKYKADVEAIDRRLAEIAREKRAIANSTNPKAIEQYSKLEREKRELANKKVELARDKRTVEDMINNINLNMTDKDMVMINQSSRDILNDISLSDTFKGLKISVGDMQMSDLLSVNKAFLEKSAKLGYQFINIDGTFDIKLLKSLSAKELKDKFGISTSTRDMLIKINERGVWGHTGSTLGKMSGMTITFLLQHTEDETLTQINQVRQSVGYVRELQKTIRRSSNINVEDWIKARRERARANRTDANPSRGGRRNPRARREGELTERGKRRMERYAQRQERNFRRIEMNRNSIRARFSKAYMKVQEAFAKSLLGKALALASKALYAFLGLLGIAVGLLGVIIGGAVLIIVLIYFCILSLLNANPQAWINNLLAPDTYADTVAYQLYETLALHEENFLEEVKDVDDIYENRTTLKYGIRYTDYDNYITKDTRIIESDGEMYINPFSRYGVVSLTNNSDKLTLIDEYNGMTKYDLITNSNAYNMITDDPNVTYQMCIENGHTSNIKDIIAMVDVMYQFSMEENSDDSMNDLLGMTPAQINWNNFCEKVKNVFKWIGNTVSEFFNPDNEPPFIYVETVSYKTIQNYAVTLFECSHQQTINLELKFYNRERRLYATDGVYSQDITETNFGAGFGLCSNPHKEYFKIRYDTGAYRVAPYLTDPNGIGYNLDEGLFDVNVTMDMLVSGNHNVACVYESWDSNFTTYSAIKNIAEGVYGNYCWYKDPATVQTTTISKTTTSTSEDVARNTNYSWADHYFPTSTYTLDDGKNTMKVDMYRQDMDESVTSWTEEYQDQDANGNPLYDENGDPVMIEVTYYKVTLRWGYRDEFKYRRNCNGHQFEYCGGHIEVHSQGIVYSATNEQLALTSVYPKGTAPCVPTFLDDKVNMGYEELKGKINSKTLVLDGSIYDAINSGHGGYPVDDVQGSYSGMYGLNLWVENDEWVADSNGMDGSTQYPQYTLDIFDIDTALKKGSNIFPLNHFSKFEGWTSENMTLALAKMSMDWHEMYGFDIPWEITNSSTDSALSQDDIDAIVEAVKMRYGSNLTAEREEAIRFALLWVNRGHYVDSPLHAKHCYLWDYCQSVYMAEVHHPDGTMDAISRKANCSAGTDIDFVNFMYKYFGKVSTSPHSLKTSYRTTTLVNGAYYSNVYPADVVVHHGVMTTIGSTINTMPINRSALVNNGYNTPYDYFSTMTRTQGMIASSRYAKDQTVIYIGMVNNDITLSTGQIVKANTPLFVDMQQADVGGCITLHSLPSTSSGGMFGSTFLESGNQNVYFWADHLDGRVSVFSFDQP